MFADYAFEHYLAKGYSPQKAAAAVGAFMQESGEDLDPRTVHDNNTGIGIAGWRDEKPGVGRKTDFLNWAKQNELDPYDIDTQLDYFDYDITEGGHKNIGALLDQADNLDDAVGAMVHYERPQGYDPNDVTKVNGYSNRLSYAQNLYNTFVGNDGPQPQAIDMNDDSLADAPDKPTDDEDVELEPYPEASADDKDEAEVETPKTPRQKAGQALLSTAAKMASSSDEPFDYTPAGQNMDVNADYNFGIPVDEYEQYLPMYRDGGVVGDQDFLEYAKMIGAV